MNEGPIERMLRDISDNFNDLGGEGRISLVFDWPVIVTINGVRVETTVRMRWTEHGVEIVDVEEQARHIAGEIARHLEGAETCSTEAS